MLDRILIYFSHAQTHSSSSVPCLFPHLTDGVCFSHLSHDAAHPKRDLKLFFLAPMFIYQHLTSLFSKVTPEKVVWISICNKQQEFVAVKVSQCKIICGFSRLIWCLSNLPNHPQPQGMNHVSPALLPVFDISPLSSLNAILRGAYSTFWSTLLNLQYPNSIISMWKLSTDKVNASSEQTYAADTKAHFGTKEYLNREKEIHSPFLSSRISQFAKFCPLLSHE